MRSNGGWESWKIRKPKTRDNVSSNGKHDFQPDLHENMGKQTFFILHEIGHIYSYFSQP